MEFEIDEVESVEFLNDDEQYVYDVGMLESPHTFFANDMLVHNSVYTDVGGLLLSMGINYEKFNDDKICSIVNEKLAPMVQDLIQVAMEDLSYNSGRVKENTIFFKRESIARRGIFLEKKKYVMWEINGEGDVKTDKLKSTGVEIIRSSTPTLAKKYLKQTVYNILKIMDRDKIVKELREIRNSFLEADVESIAFPRGANNVKKYTDEYIKRQSFKGTPIHIRGSIEYNMMLEKKKNLMKKYDLIFEGDKIKFLYMKSSPTFRSNIIAFKDKWVKEFKLDEYIDRELQFEKSFLEPLKKFFILLDWQIPNFNHVDLLELFS